MGASYTNVQVHLTGRPAEEIRSQVVDALRRWVLTGPFVESEPGDPDADRTVVVAPAGPEPWIAVYDDFLNFDKLEPLIGLAQILSAAVGGQALGIVLDDSSALELHLFRDGAPVDVYSNLPGHFRDVSPRERRAFAGRPDLWQDLLVAGKSPTDLRAAWDEAFIFVEDTLRGVARLLDLNPQRCLANFTTLEEKPEPGTIWLSFRRTTSVPELVRAEGLPVFKTPYGGPPERDVVAGDRICRPLLSLFVQNIGGPSRGMAVVVAGPALDQGLVQIDEVVIVDRGYLTVQAVLEGKEAGGKRAYVARLPDWELPAGIVRPEGPPVQIGWRKQWQKYREEAQDPPIIGVHVQGQALLAGTAELFVGAAPLSNLEGGVAQRLVLRVAEPQR